MRPLVRFLAVAALLALPACSVAVRRAPQPSADRDAIIRALEASTAEWRSGNLDGFLAVYGADATYVGGSGLVHGKPAIRDRYANSYFRPGAAPPGNLSYRDIEVRPLGDDFALVVGRWVVTDRATAAQTATGWFSLTMERQPDGWRIIHDHSS
ncbi:MAG TPA: nuclear transport factor 2 family protein [Longimicrobiaceae bacterium]|nr:nuclear transport factor 2 family protein [Longimicrobiaceae bacterium]